MDTAAAVLDTALSRRQFLRLIGVATGAIASDGLLAACGGDDDDDDDGPTTGEDAATSTAVDDAAPTGVTSEPTTSSGESAASGGVLRVAAVQDGYAPSRTAPTSVSTPSTRTSSTNS